MAESRRIVLSDGRSCVLVDPGPDKLLDLILGVGAEASMNPVWMNYATHAASVTELEGQPLPFPTTDAAVKNVLRKLGSQGFADVFRANTPEKSAGDAVESEDPAKN